jgi:hypothetical protein
MKYKIQFSKADILTLLKSGHFNFALTVQMRKFVGLEFICCHQPEQ